MIAPSFQLVLTAETIATLINSQPMSREWIVLIPGVLEKWASYIIPRLNVPRRPIFSALRISNLQVIHQGKSAKIKSMMIL
jgi:hypothetical protein